MIEQRVLPFVYSCDLFVRDWKNKAEALLQLFHESSTFQQLRKLFVFGRVNVRSSISNKISRYDILAARCCLQFFCFVNMTPTELSPRWNLCLLMKSSLACNLQAVKWRRVAVISLIACHAKLVGIFPANKVLLPLNLPPELIDTPIKCDGNVNQNPSIELKANPIPIYQTVWKAKSTQIDEFIGRTCRT